MRVLIVHNRYKISGGEDSVVLNEEALLNANDTNAKTLYFDNSEIKGVKAKLKTGIQSFYNLDSNFIIESEVSKLKPDVIHIHNYFPKISPSIFYLADRLNIPIVQTIHNYRMICPGALLLRNEKVCEECINSRFAYKGIINKCYRDSALQTGVVATVNFIHNQLNTWKERVDGFIFLTDFAKDKFVASSLRLEATRLFVKPNFVEDNGFTYSRDAHFLFVGRLSKEKGVDVLLDAFKQCGHIIKIIGTGPLESLVKEIADKHTNIEFLGKQTSDVVIEQMKRCRALVFPSIWYEGMPMSVLEAFSTGCPVIASNLGAMQSLIINEYNGLHYEVGNPHGLLKCLNSVTDEMGDNARKTYIAHYTPEKNYQNLMDIYQRVIDAKAKNN